MLCYCSNSTIKTACNGLYYFMCNFSQMARPAAMFAHLSIHIQFSQHSILILTAHFCEMHQTFISASSHLGWQDGERWWGRERRREEGKELLICASQQRSESWEVSGTDRKRVLEPPIHLPTIQKHPELSALQHSTLSALIILITHSQSREGSLMQLLPHLHTVCKPTLRCRDIEISVLVKEKKASKKEILPWGRAMLSLILFTS